MLTVLLRKYRVDATVFLKLKGNEAHVYENMYERWEKTV